MWLCVLLRVCGTCTWSVAVNDDLAQPCLSQTMESVVCVLRNLSYQLESEVDLQDGAEDVLDWEWEAEQRRELEEASMG